MAIRKNILEGLSVLLAASCACSPDFSAVSTSSSSSSSSSTTAPQDASTSSTSDPDTSTTTSPDPLPDVPAEPPNPRALSLSLGGTSSCATFDDGELRCWGGGSIGTREEDMPAHAFGAPEVGGGVLGVADGVARCAWLDTDVARCWNNPNYDGTTGYGYPALFGDDEDPVYAPQLEALITPSLIVAGLYHVCAADSRGVVVCWGGNDYYQLGYGNTETIGDDEKPEDAGRVQTGGPVTALGVGGGFTCALRNDGVVCWGANGGGSGRLGQGTEPVYDFADPAMLPAIQLGGTPVRLAVGESHACAVLSNGAVRCWGSSEHGVLGLGEGVGDGLDVGDDEVPGVMPAINLGFGAEAIDVTCGYENTCALLDDGSVRCWGIHAVLGQGMGPQTIGDDETPASVTAIALPLPATHIALSKFAFAHACAILSDGTIRCWGDARGGALGYGDTEDIGDDETPAELPPVPVFEP
ncbi:MAG: hypothetical protein IAG13_37475 [Deltaproteobacteria bacterium]|nr:hypothetical protein [Nannocystaceae bacterium]